jgi:hypothetical protein
MRGPAHKLDAWSCPQLPDEIVAILKEQGNDLVWAGNLDVLPGQFVEDQLRFRLAEEVARAIVGVRSERFPDNFSNVDGFRLGCSAAGGKPKRSQG